MSAEAVYSSVSKVFKKSAGQKLPTTTTSL